jgi:hypothetical protein
MIGAILAWCSLGFIAGLLMDAWHHGAVKRQVDFTRINESRGSCIFFTLYWVMTGPVFWVYSALQKENRR